MTAFKKSRFHSFFILGLFAVLTVCAPLSALADEQPGPNPGLGPPPQGMDLSTPRATVREFLDSTRSGDFARAAHAMDLRAIARAEQAETGRRLARQLRYVLDRTSRIDVGALSEDPTGNPEDGLFKERVGSVKLQNGEVPLRLSRVTVEKGSAVWLFSRDTVRAIPELYEEYGPGAFGELLPDWAHRRSFMNISAWHWVGLGLALLLAIVAAMLLAALMLAVARRIASRTDTKWDDLVVAGARGPLRAFLALAIFAALSPSLKLPLFAESALGKIIGSLLIASVAWLAMRIVDAISESVALGLVAQQEDELMQQGTRSRVRVVRRIVNALVLLFATALALTQFEVVRRVGVSMLASAGIAGVVLGLAAQKVLGNLLAGVQLAVSQPLRIGDRVFVENEFGFVEEMGLTHVVIKTWDERRLVLPITYFVEKPFENWTRTSPQLVGIVMIHADYRLSVDKVREEFLRLVREDPDWDGENADLVVVEATDHTLTLRGTATADGTRVWGLRCRLRERLVEFLQQLDGGRYLPRTRVELPGRAAA